MSEWRTVVEEFSYGIAIYNFNEEGPEKLKLTVGDAVHILEAEDNWYYGYVINNNTTKQQRGIFPKNYIFIKPCKSVDTTGSIPDFIFKESPISKEITSVLREWGIHWKNLYMMHNKDFDIVKKQMNDLINHRSKIISGTLPQDEMKRITRQAAEEIDMGNKTLGLDLVVRDKDGHFINPENISTIKLFNLHKSASERMSRRVKSDSKASQPKSAVQQYSNVFIVSVRNFTCKMTEDAELLLTLYDGKEFKPITENYVVKWTKEGLMSDLDQMYNLRVMFTDLGKRDLEREKIFLICYVVRIGAMDTKETDHSRRSSVASNTKKVYCENMRRPFGVAAMDITSYMNGTLDCDLEREFSVPYVGCEKDNLEQTLRKIISKEKFENKNSSLIVTMQLLHGDLKQVREENPHLVLGNVAVARKLGFPEVILPGDVRNDLYLTLVSGEFSKGNKTSEKNIEVVVKVCNNKGQQIPAVISHGAGVQAINEFRSVIYYHEDKPQWHETFKVAIPIEEFKTSHLKFTFKHRSSNEAKDKSEKPFAMAYVKLMQDNGTTLKDDKHNLVIYKIDYKKFSDDSIDYFKLPSTTAELKDGVKPQISGLTMSSKDSFCISSNICSTKLTQNVDLLGLLNWASHKDTLKESLQALMKVDGEEVVKFLQDILDALFNILMDNQETDTYDTLVFECLLFIIGLVSNDWKYQHFEPVLDLYIKESFSATLAYKKLISVLKAIILKTNFGISQNDLIFKTMKSIQYVMRFVSRSRILYTRYTEVIEPDDTFEEKLKDLLYDIINMMSSNKDDLLREQGACLKYLPSTIPDILSVFDPVELSRLLRKMLLSIPKGRLTKQKMMTINEIVHSKLFLYPECRTILLPIITDQVKTLFEIKEEGLATRQDVRRQNRSVAKVAQLLGTTQHCVNQHVGYSEEVELCIKIMGDILDMLFQKNTGPTDSDLKEIIHRDLRTIIQAHIKMDKDNPHAATLVAVMIDIFRQMTETHYTEYIATFSTHFDILDFLMEILVVFKELVNNSVFPSDWCDMIMLQNSIILKSLRFFSHTIRDHFFEKFEYDAWNNFFHCAIAFMIQPALQLETFSPNKKKRVIKKYGDMRRQTGFEVVSMWFNLGQYKVQFVPSLVELILEMTLIPETEHRKHTIKIFFDMMQCEFYSSKYLLESYGDTRRDSSHIKANFNDFENELIQKLDTLFCYKGDEQYKILFHDIMIELCSQHTTMKDEGIKFVKIVTTLMESLLEYRNIISDENKENKMSSTVNLLDFYSEISKKDMYVRYVNKLHDLHLECDNYTEAAFTLELYAQLLDWSDQELPPLLYSSKFGNVRTHRQLKEELYASIIDNFNKGKMWEYAIKKCQELATQFENETFDYENLSSLHTKMASFYEDILKKNRADPEYFRVAYYGKGFPRILQNKIFIYRGKEYERLNDFNVRVLNQFPKAELLNNLNTPGEEITESSKQYIQINNVNPIMEEKKHRFSGKPVSTQILKYYTVNDIDKFSYSQPFTKTDTELNTENSFGHMWLKRTILTTTYSLPGILRWFPVKQTVVEEISPLRNAIETMEKTNKNLKNFVTTYNKDKNIPINPLSLILTGILDPAVMGGIKNYEEVFFQSNYSQVHPEDEVLMQRLKDLIADQVPLLELCVQIHKQRIPPTLDPLQKQLEIKLVALRAEVEEKYGKGTCDVKLENEVQMRRHYSMNSDSKPLHTSATADFVGGRSRVSSLTRSQVATLKNFTSTFNFSASPSANSKTHSTNSKSLITPSRNLVGTPSLTHKKSTKLSKEKRRRSSKSDMISPLGNSATQWYTSSEDNIANNGITKIELTQELTPKRPLRSEVERERRLSRPQSGQFSRPNSTVTLRTASSSGNSSNRDSIETTDSSVCEEEIVPPPLPLKQREVDYSSLTCISIKEKDIEYSNIMTGNVSFLNSYRASLTCMESKNEGSIDLDDVPPTPPPKPPKIKNCNGII